MYKRGWIFQDWGIRAILAGQKTMTRRIQGLEYINKEPDNWELIPPETIPYVMGATFRSKQDASIVNMKCPYQVGDILWLRETFCYAKPFGYDARDDGGEIWYRSTDQNVCEGPWKPSIFMPQRASRIDVEITGIKAPERVQSIPEDDAIREGFEPDAKEIWWQGYREMDYKNGQTDLVHQEYIGDEPPSWMIEPHKMLDKPWPRFSAKLKFENKWIEIHGPGAWRRNDWVWPYEFSLITLIGG